eukprot:135946_1
MKEQDRKNPLNPPSLLSMATNHHGKVIQKRKSCKRCQRSQKRVRFFSLCPSIQSTPLQCIGHPSRALLSAPFDTFMDVWAIRMPLLTKSCLDFDPNTLIVLSIFWTIRFVAGAMIHVW